MKRLSQGQERSEKEEAERVHQARPCARCILAVRAARSSGTVAERRIRTKPKVLKLCEEPQRSNPGVLRTPLEQAAAA